MTLLTTIKQAHLNARRARDATTVSSLISLIGDIEMVGKNAGRDVTDSDTVAMLKKYIKNVQEVLVHVSRQDNIDAARRVAAQAELDLYESFLPKQLSIEELTQVVAQLKIELNATSPKDMGLIMRTLKERYDGQYDGAAASAAVKAALVA